MIKELEETAHWYFLMPFLCTVSSFCYPAIKDYTVNATVIWLAHEVRNKQRVLMNPDFHVSFWLLKFVVFGQTGIYLSTS